MNDTENPSQTAPVENQTESSNEVASLIETNNASENKIESIENNQKSMDNPELEVPSKSPESLRESTSRETRDNSEQPSSELQDDDQLSDKDEFEEEPLPSLTSEWIKVDLAPLLTLAQLNDLYEQLGQYQHCRVQLCGEKVERVDTAALQLLLIFRNNPDITVGWIEPSTELCHAAQIVGLLSQLGLPHKDPPLFFPNH